MYSSKHILLLAASFIGIFLIYYFMRKTPLRKWYIFLMYVGVISETVKVISYVVKNEALYGGYLPKTDLPFQLCSVQLVFIAILRFSENEKFRRLLLSFMIPSCLFGGIAALLLPTSSSLNMPSVTVQYFLYHTVIAAFALHLLFSSGITWTMKDYTNALKMLAFMGLIAIYLNSITYDVVGYVEDGVQKTVQYVSRVNFMYVVDPPVAGLPYLNKNQGWLVYLIRYAVLAVFAVSVCYSGVIIRAFRKKT